MWPNPQETVGQIDPLPQKKLPSKSPALLGLKHTVFNRLLLNKWKIILQVVIKGQKSIKFHVITLNLCITRNQ